MKTYAIVIPVSLACVAGLVYLLSGVIYSEPSIDRFKLVAPREGQDPNGPIDTSMESIPGGSHVNRDPIDADEPAPVVDPSQKNSLPADLVADGFQIAAVLQVQQLLKSQLVGTVLESIDTPLEEIENETGFPLAQIERMIILSESLSFFPAGQTSRPAPLPAIDGQASGPSGDEIAQEFVAAEPVFNFAIIVQFRADAVLTDIRTQLISRIPGDWQEQQLEGKSCLINKAETVPAVPDCICLMDDQTLVISRQELLLKMIAADGSSPLAIALSTVSLDNDLIVTATPGVLPEGIMDGLKESILPQMAALASLPNNLATATLNLRVSSDPQLQLELNAKSRTTAITAQIAISSVISLLELMVPELKKQLAMDPNADPVAVAGMELAENLLKAFDVERTGLTTTVTVALPEEALEAGVGLLQDSLGSARSSAANLSNMNNLKQIGLGIMNYLVTNEKYPVGEGERIQFKDGKPLLSWRVHILPFLDQEELYNQFHLDEPWDSEHNMTLLEKMPFPYVDHAQELPPGITNFLAPVSERSILGATTELTQNHIADGTSSTVLVLMASADKGVPWTSPADLQIDPADPIGSLGELGDSVVVLFADGSVKPIQLPIEPQQLLNLFNRDDRIPATPADSP